MKELLEKLLQKESLSIEETHRLFGGLIGDAPNEMKAALLTALRAKGESETEILGMAQQMRKHAVPLPAEMRQAMDTCGTGGDGSRSLNLSTISALVLSSMGVPQVKHGNRSVSSTCGSADLLEGLGIPLDISPEGSFTLFKETNFAFLFAPLYHPAMKSVAPVRKAMQIRTIFNFLGPLSNPAQVYYQVLGVPAPDRVRPFAEVLKHLGLKSAIVVHGEPGLDEISPCGKTKVAYFMDQGNLTEETWTPEQMGIKSVRRETLAVAGPQEAISRARAVLSGKNAPDGDLSAVAVNAAAGLFIHGRYNNLSDAVSAAGSHLAGGQALKHFERILQTATKIKN